ncbi:hypothetical protein T439DRAFT_383117 [Meredithblackwellia eburnea MCA 4105]
MDPPRCGRAYLPNSGDDDDFSEGPSSRRSSGPREIRKQARLADPRTPGSHINHREEEAQLRRAILPATILVVGLLLTFRRTPFTETDYEKDGRSRGPFSSAVDQALMAFRDRCFPSPNGQKRWSEIAAKKMGEVSKRMMICVTREEERNATTTTSRGEPFFMKPMAVCSLGGPYNKDLKFEYLMLAHFALTRGNGADDRTRRRVCIFPVGWDESNKSYRPLEGFHWMYANIELIRVPEHGELFHWNTEKKKFGGNEPFTFPDWFSDPTKILSLATWKGVPGSLTAANEGAAKMGNLKYEILKTLEWLHLTPRGQNGSLPDHMIAPDEREGDTRGAKRLTLVIEVLIDDKKRLPPPEEMSLVFPHPDKERRRQEQSDVTMMKFLGWKNNRFRYLAFHCRREKGEWRQVVDLDAVRIDFDFEACMAQVAKIRKHIEEERTGRTGSEGATQPSYTGNPAQSGYHSRQEYPRGTVDTPEVAGKSVCTIKCVLQGQEPEPYSSYFVEFGIDPPLKVAGKSPKVDYRENGGSKGSFSRAVDQALNAFCDHCFPSRSGHKRRVEVSNRIASNGLRSMEKIMRITTTLDEEKEARDPKGQNLFMDPLAVCSIEGQCNGLNFSYLMFAHYALAHALENGNLTRRVIVFPVEWDTRTKQYWALKGFHWMYADIELARVSEHGRMLSHWDGDSEEFEPFTFPNWFSDPKEIDLLAKWKGFANHPVSAELEGFKQLKSLNPEIRKTLEWLELKPREEDDSMLIRGRAKADEAQVGSDGKQRLRLIIKVSVANGVREPPEEMSLIFPNPDKELREKGHFTVMKFLGWRDSSFEYLVIHCFQDREGRMRPVKGYDAVRIDFDFQAYMAQLEAQKREEEKDRNRSKKGKEPERTTRFGYSYRYEAGTWRPDELAKLASEPAIQAAITAHLAHQLSQRRFTDTKGDSGQATQQERQRLAQLITRLSTIKSSTSFLQLALYAAAYQPLNATLVSKTIRTALNHDPLLAKECALVGPGALQLACNQVSDQIQSLEEGILLVQLITSVSIHLSLAASTPTLSTIYATSPLVFKSLNKAYNSITFYSSPPSSFTTDVSRKLHLKLAILATFHTLIETAFLIPLQSAEDSPTARNSLWESLLAVLPPFPEASPRRGATALWDQPLLGDLQTLYGTGDDLLLLAGMNSQRRAVADSMRRLRVSSEIKGTVDVLKVLNGHQVVVLAPAAGQVAKDDKKGKGKAKEDDPALPDDDLAVSKILDILPHLSPVYISRALKHDRFKGNTESLISALLEDDLPPELRDLSEDTDRALPSPPPPPPAPPAAVPTPRPTKSVRANVFDDIRLDPSKLRRGKMQDNAEALLSDHSFLTEDIKAAIITRAEAESSDEEGDEEGRDGEVEPEDEGGGFKVRDGDLEEEAQGSGKEGEDNEPAGTSGTQAPKSGDALSNPITPAISNILELAYIATPGVFDRNSTVRKSKQRQELREKTGMADEQLEGWKIMFERNPKKDKILAKHEFSGNQKGDQVPVNSNPKSGGGDQRKGQQQQQGGGGDSSRGGGRGGRGGRGRGKGDGGRAAHDRRQRGNDRKMAKMV